MTRYRKIPCHNDIIRMQIGTPITMQKNHLAKLVVTSVDPRTFEHTRRQDMRKLHLPIILLWLIILLSGCCTGNPVRLYQIDSGRTIKVGPGDTVEIVLDSNPTTGYQWEALPWDTEVIEQIDKPVYKSRSKAIGSGGELTFYFKALSTGQAPLKFIYFRAFEKDVPPIKSFQVTIVVS